MFRYGVISGPYSPVFRLNTDMDLLGFRRSTFDTYYQRCIKTTQIAMFPSSRKKTKVSDEVRFDKWVIGLVKQNNDDVVNVKKTTIYFCEKCSVALHPNFLRGSMNSNILTEWLAKKTLPLGAALCNLFTDILKKLWIWS